MQYEIEIKPQATKDARGIPRDILIRVFDKIQAMGTDLQGDVKRLTNFSPEYRLRVGECRVLFEVENTKIVIYRIKHRKDAYR